MEMVCIIREIATDYLRHALGVLHLPVVFSTDVCVCVCVCVEGLGSSAGIATRNGLDGPGI
jgi:hypothetical protein